MPLPGETGSGGGPACVNTPEGEIVPPDEIPPRTDRTRTATEQTRLCDLILESLPPQCGRVALQVKGLEFDKDDFERRDVRKRDGEIWSEKRIALSGFVVAHGVLQDAEWAQGARSPKRPE